jgi:DNA mismatch repair protein MutS
VIDASKHARDWIANLESVEREKTGIKTLKVGYNKVFGYYIEISRGAADKAPRKLHPQADAGQRRALHHAGDEGIRNAGVERRRTHQRDRNAPCSAKSAPNWQSLRINFCQPRAPLPNWMFCPLLGEAAALGGYTKPQVHEGSGLEIHEGRIPLSNSC